jgi:ubiquinone/menaquinone biosynthesis C-methylase UbiE
MAEAHPAYSLALSDAEVARYRMMASIARELEAEAWTAAGIVAGARVADVGCGPGLVTLELADVVGPAGSVVGVDREADAVATAARLIDDAGLAHASARQGAADATGLPAGDFDVVNIRHVLAHNSDPGQGEILEHVATLLRPEGRLYLVDADGTAGRSDPDEPVLREMLTTYAAHLRDTGRAFDVGPRLGSLCRAHGFELLERRAWVQIVPAAALTEVRPPPWAAREAMLASGHVTPADVARWDAELTRIAATAIEEDRAFFMPLYSATARTTARRPSA